MNLPNDLLRRAREATVSPSGSGEPLSRTELAQAVNAHVQAVTGRPGILDANRLGKLERGTIRWPHGVYRQALRTILGVQTDADLGFADPRTETATVHSPALTIVCHGGPTCPVTAAHAALLSGTATEGPMRPGVSPGYTADPAAQGGGTP